MEKSKNNEETVFISYYRRDNVIANNVEKALRQKLGDQIKITKFSEVPYKKASKSL